MKRWLSLFAVVCACTRTGSLLSGGAGTGGEMGAGGQGGEDHGINVSGGQGGAMGDCASPCDPSKEVCSHGSCIPLSSCASDDDCRNDTTCGQGNICVPWDGQAPAHDPACVNATAPGVLSPKIKCEFSKAPPGDPFPTHVDVQGTPIVVNFRKPSNSGPPSIAVTFSPKIDGTYSEARGVIRVLRGDDCTLEANLGGVDLDGDNKTDWIVSPASLAAGDLDGDGVAEIVAYGSDGSTLAFTKKNNQWGLFWKSPYIGGQVMPPCSPNETCVFGWAGPAIHDIDDDGIPEVIREGTVLAADGKILSGPPLGYQTYFEGLFPVMANLDQDPAVEFTNGSRVWEWTQGGWKLDPMFPDLNPTGPGHVAIADFGAFGGPNVPAKTPEIVVVRSGQVTILATDGMLTMPPVAVPGAGGGGPPTISDFDGDGLPEVGVAGQALYAVYDIDCGPNPRPGGKCDLGRCDHLGGVQCPAGEYLLWTRATQDISSNVTGSSVFDFEADGTSEVVYADECFVRVYNGKTGDVLFSQYHSSCTWYENPVIADVDGNFRADLVTPSNKACSPDGNGLACNMLDANGVDKQFPGLRCKKAGDCVSGVCDAGFCRCATGADCCAALDTAACLEEGHKCAPPPPGTPGAGNTCRAAHPHGLSGIRVYSDANDHWVRSRTIWNQHPYSVTHVNEDGTIPKTSAWKDNWEDPTLNNFRQNVPGTANGKSTGDATAGASSQYACFGGGVTLSSPICNRGADPIGAGLHVGFFVGGQKVCGAKTSGALQEEQCEIVSCTWAKPPLSEQSKVDVDVVPNDDGAYQECKKGNNHGTVLGVFCAPPP